MGVVTAILSDFDGILCPTSDMKYDYNNSELISHSIEDILCKVSLTIPISIVTSKDFDFIYRRTKKFAKILSCILGLETFVLDHHKQLDHDVNHLSSTKKLNNEGTIIKDRYLFFDYEMLSTNSDILNEIIAYLEKNCQKINIEKKFLKGEENLLGELQ